MKRIVSFVLIAILIFCITGCGIGGTKNNNTGTSDSWIANSEENEMKEYKQNEDGSWECEGNTYQYKLELKGYDKNSEIEGCMVVLTNNPDITYEEVSRSILSSKIEDGLDTKETVIIRMNAEK